MEKIEYLCPDWPLCKGKVVEDGGKEILCPVCGQKMKTFAEYWKNTTLGFKGLSTPGK
jgi:hypothetical protein